MGIYFAERWVNHSNGLTECYFKPKRVERFESSALLLLGATYFEIIYKSTMQYFLKSVFLKFMF